jgi:hypothetical protein
MSSSRLSAACVRKLERRVRSVFEARRGLPDDVYEAPYIGGEYRPRAPREQHADLIYKASKALCAQFWFDRTAPGWAKAHGLPIRMEACEEMLKDADPRLKALGLYGLALRLDGWNYSTFEPFDDAYVQQFANIGCPV